MMVGERLCAVFYRDVGMKTPFCLNKPGITGFGSIQLFQGENVLQ